jgi:hypothetical protein
VLILCKTSGPRDFARFSAPYLDLGTRLGWPNLDLGRLGHYVLGHNILCLRTILCEHTLKVTLTYPTGPFVEKLFGGVLIT